MKSDKELANWLALKRQLNYQIYEKYALQRGSF